MRRSDLQLLPAATVVWALAVLGITVGAAAGIAGAAVIVSLALAAVMLLGGTRTAHAVFAHLGVMALAGALLFPALQRHTAATEVLEDAAAEAQIGRASCRERVQITVGGVLSITNQLGDLLWLLTC